MGKSFRKKNWKSRGKNQYFRNSENGAQRKTKSFTTTGQLNTDAEIKSYLKESQFGITEFVTNSKGFTGILKARFSDFHVNEIEPSGKVLQLDDVTVPNPKEEILESMDVETLKNNLNDIIPAALWSQIEEFAKQGVECGDYIEVDVTNIDKDKRTEIHKVLKKLYENRLASTTINNTKDDAVEEKIIRIFKPQRKIDKIRNDWLFPGDYVHFLIHKENMETSEVATAIANRLNLRSSQVNYCGNKDKRGKTTQKFCIKRRSPMQIMSALRGINNIHVGNFEFSDETLKLGNLKGNRFRIALRHIDGEEDAIETSLKEVKDTGFINYYGLQRFGNCVSIPTYDVGVALLKANYKEACELILKPRDNDVDFMRVIRETWWSKRNSANAAAMFHGNKTIEQKLLKGLAYCGENDYASALRMISRNVLLLYTHSFQSLIFNHVASRRIKEFGMKLIPGDLVYRKKVNNEEDIAAQLAVDGEMDATVKDEMRDECTESVYKQKVKALTADDIASGEYCLFDVVLPLPGHDITLPDNVIAKWYDELLLDYDLSIEKLKTHSKFYALAGTYRKLVIKPEQMTWTFRTYDKPEDTLISSDWETLNDSKVVADDDGNGKFRALLIDVCLPASVYATMFVREILKTDTSALNQAKLQRAELMKHNNESASDQMEDDNSVKRKLEEDNNVDVTENVDTKKAKTDESNQSKE